MPVLRLHGSGFRMMEGLPDIALSVRQPWTWGIIHAGKPVENRDWRRPNPGL